MFLQLGVDLNASEDEDPEGPIVDAAREGHFEMVHWLLDHGAKINFEVEGQTRCFALVGAIVCGHLSIVKLLVERGANVNANWRGMTPLSYALGYGQKEIAAYLRSVGALLESSQFPSKFSRGQLAILHHFEKNRGKPASLSLQEIVSSDPPISIYVVPPSKKWKGQTIFTVGMSERPLHLPRGGERFAELAIYLPNDWLLGTEALADPNWNWPITWLRRIANYLHQEGKWPGDPSVVFSNGEPPQPLAPNTKLCCLLALVESGDFGQIELPEEKVASVFSLYPIYLLTFRTFV